MVARRRTLCPDIEVREGDAGNLSDFPASRFKLVFFSYNGIDNLGHEQRLRVLDEARRVVQRDGLFGVLDACEVWPCAIWSVLRLAPSRDPSEPAVKHAGRWLYGFVTGISKYQETLTRWRQAKTKAEDHGEWALAPLVALDFEMAHFTTVAGETKALTEHGFEVVRMVADHGRALRECYVGLRLVPRRCPQSERRIAVHMIESRPRVRRGRSSGGRCPGFRRVEGPMRGRAIPLEEVMKSTP